MEIHKAPNLHVESTTKDMLVHGFAAEVQKHQASALPVSQGSFGQQPLQAPEGRKEGLPGFGVPYWGAYYKGILPFRDRNGGSPHVRNPKP